VRSLKTITFANRRIKKRLASKKNFKRNKGNFGTIAEVLE